MQQLFLCQTQDYHPRQLEHLFHTLQKKELLEVMLCEKNGKVEWWVSEDWSKELRGSRVATGKVQHPAPRFWVKQKKGPLLPIKRWSQLEDRSNKTRINPLDSLLLKMASTPGSFIHLKFKPVSEKKREAAVKKVKQSYFEPDRLLDQWESKAWFKWGWRRFLGPLLRSQLHGQALSPKKPEEQTQSLHEREDPRSAILDKLSRPLFLGELTLSHPFSDFFHGFSLPYLGELTLSRKPQSLVFSAEELASLLCPPTPSTAPSYLTMESSIYLPHPLKNPWKLSPEDRKRHLYLLGKTGMGKSTALLHLFKEDLAKNEALILLDPHGDLVEEALTLVPQERQKDLLVCDPSESEFPLALNPLENEGESPSLKASALVEMFKTLAAGSWGPRLEHILRNSLLLLIQSPNSTLLDLPRLLTDSDFCQKKLHQLKDLELSRFFEEEYFSLDPRLRQEHSAPLLNKIGPFISSPLLRNIFGQPKTKLKIEKVLSQKKILLINLSKGKLGEDASRFLGMVILSMIHHSLLGRASLPLEERASVFLSIDEFQNFNTPTLLSMLSELRKYGLALTLANQYLTQMPEEIQDAVLGNVGSLVCFRSSQEDALKLAPILNLNEKDLTELNPFEAYSRFLRDQNLESVFRIHIEKPSPIVMTSKEKIKKHSREQLTRPRLQVEEKLKIRYT